MKLEEFLKNNKLYIIVFQKQIYIYVDIYSYDRTNIIGLLIDFSFQNYEYTFFVV